MKVVTLSAQVRSLREELSVARCRGTPCSVDGIDIDIEREGPQPFFADINKESEGPPPREVPPPFFVDINKESESPPLGKVPPPDTTGINTKVEDPRPEEVPPATADKFFELTGEVSSPVMELQTCTC
ncbi:uncharacterized protein A4U43_C07F8650 [Asparagus officinalis]|uniref:Uncharacterized protein n=1 Tax=Asparagus officinalis TaxID=4686 RepID=A0A5P1EAF4_ASPOF|nr:uncharacterized protein A4U43_C07F8650 [Asparagus officinalis]